MSIQYSSKESNPSGTKASGFTLAPDPKQQPALWTPSDRLGPNGRRDRLVETIQLSPEDLRDLMLFIYENETYGGVHCTEKVFYKHVPRTFETAIVNQASARYALNHAIGRNFRRHIPGIHLESHVSDDSPMRRRAYVFSISPHKSVDHRELMARSSTFCDMMKLLTFHHYTTRPSLWIGRDSELFSCTPQHLSERC